MHRTHVTRITLLLLLVAPSVGAAQSIRGTVRDATTGEPVAGALVALMSGDSTVRRTALTDRTGGFVIPVAIGDTVWLRVRQLGYATAESDAVVFHRDETLELAVELRARPVEIEGVTATARASRRLEEFRTRERSGFGSYLGPERIAELPQRSTRTLFQALPRAGPIRTERGSFCYPSIFVDGMLLTDTVSIPGVTPPLVSERVITDDPGRAGATPPLNAPRGGGPARAPVVRSIDALVPHAELRAIEVYRNHTQAPAEFQRGWGRCPVILIWTAHGFAESGS